MLAVEGAAGGRGPQVMRRRHVRRANPTEAGQVQPARFSRPGSAGLVQPDWF